MTDFVVTMLSSAFGGLSSRPRYEQSLVEWASSRLHDKESLAEMVDPGMSRTMPSKTLSRLAHMISLCIQVCIMIMTLHIYMHHHTSVNGN